MGNWKTLEALTDRMVLGANDELVRHYPQKNGTADPGRPIQDIRAILHHPGIDGALTFGGGMLTSVAASKHYLVIERAKYPSMVFAAKDRFRGSERPGTPIFEVSKTNDRHSSIIMLELGEA